MLPFVLLTPDLLVWGVAGKDRAFRLRTAIDDGAVEKNSEFERRACSDPGAADATRHAGLVGLRSQAMAHGLTG